VSAVVRVNQAFTHAVAYRVKVLSLEIVRVNQGFTHAVAYRVKVLSLEIVYRSKELSLSVADVNHK